MTRLSSPFGPRKLIVWFEMQLVSTPSLHPRMIKHQWTRIQRQRLHLEQTFKISEEENGFTVRFRLRPWVLIGAWNRIGKPIGQETVM